MTETVLDKNYLQYLNPKYVVPLVGFLSHDTCNESGEIFEVEKYFLIFRLEEDLLQN